jgi:hypothetical protein
MASPSLTVSPTTTMLVAPSSSVTLSGLSVSGDTADQEQVTVATTLGTLSVATLTNVTLAYGDSWTGTQSVTFTGLQSSVNAVLASVSLVTTATTGTAQISLTAMVAQSGYNYLASNQHFYAYVPCSNCEWTSADTAAQQLSFNGQPGYLATIPNATVNAFISDNISQASNVWFGARAYESIATDGSQVYATANGTTYPRVWRWTEGSAESTIAGGVISECTNPTGTCTFTNGSSFYSSWSSGEPNNTGGSTTTAYQGEWAGATNWNGTSGSWNDLPNQPSSNDAVTGYVVEYGGKTNTNSSLGTGFAGVVTTSSNVVIAATAVAPSAPTVTATGADSSINLSWTPPNDGGSLITGYQVSTDDGTTWTATATTSTNTVVNGNVVTTVAATINDLTNGTSYSVQVRAVNSAGYGTASTPVAAVPVTTPAPPTTVAATAADVSATVAFTAPANTGGSTITGYTVTATPGGATATCSASPCTVTGLTNGTAYTFTVHATNSVGSGPESSASTSVTPATLPDAPTIGAVTGGNGAITVNWSAPGNTGGDPVTGYVITPYLNGVAQTPVSSTGTGTADTVTGLTNGTAYTFTVEAVTAFGTGAESAQSTTAVPATLPDAPTIGAVTGGNGAITVNWSAPGNTGGDPVTGYVITPYLNGVAQTPVSSTGTGTADTVTGLTNGTAYTFTVEAVTAFGTGAESAQSTTVTPSSPPVLRKPAAPVGPVAPDPVAPVAPTMPSVPESVVPTGGSIAATPQGTGYWALSPSGVVTNHGTAGNYGSENGAHLDAPIVAIKSTNTGDGYWEAASDGGVFTFGDATFYGSMGGTKLNQPIVGLASTPDGGGYWLVGADGGVFTFGDATFYGSMGGTKLNQPIVGLASTPDGGGYWLVGADGGVFTFGDATFNGSLGATGTVLIIGIICSGNSDYRLISRQGNAYQFGTPP